jgi:hypothetical protein
MKPTTPRFRWPLPCPFPSTCLASRLPLFVFLVGFASTAFSQPLSRSLPLDLYRDVPSRNLKGLATRSDGRLVAGPTLTDLHGAPFADILWCLEAGRDGRWLIGTGPDGKIFELTLDLAKNSYTTRELADLDDTHVFALRRLPDGALLAGTSPHGQLALLREGKIAARLTLPVDTIHDLQLSTDGTIAYLATGNPGRVYAVDLAQFSSAKPDHNTVSPALTTPALEQNGVRELAEIRDRNVHRLVVLGDTLLLGSSPKGNLYSLPSSGGEAMILLENRDAEVAALLPAPDGSALAALVFSGPPADTRLNRPPTSRPAPTSEGSGAAPSAPGAKPPGEEETPTVSPPAEMPRTAPAPPPTLDRFPGRSAVVHLPRDGLPETLLARNNLAFYALARRGDTLLIAGGEQGDVLGFDLTARVSLTYAGSDSAQVNQIAPLAPAPDPGGDKKNLRASPPTRFLLLRNNPHGLALLDFTAHGTREAETRRLDLGSPATLGALRFSHMNGLDPARLQVEVRTTLAADEAEGWSPWKPAALREDGWLAADMRGRFAKLRLRLPAEASAAQLDAPQLFFLPQNRRPQLADFRIAPAGFALAPPALSREFAPPPSSLGGLFSEPERTTRRSLNSAAVFPQPGMQIVTWTLADPDNDELRATFSIRRAADEAWLDLAVNTADGYAQFDTLHLPDGAYATRLSVAEHAPRPTPQRFTVHFETDDLVIDKTPPEIADVRVVREPVALSVTVSGRDALSLLRGATFSFNNGHREETAQPDDAIRDSRAESFTLRVPAEKALGATSVEVFLTDERGNTRSRRVGL